MRLQLTKWLIRCERCRVEVIVEGTDNIRPSLPEGWKSVPVHGCGMTGYTRWDDLCPECIKKDKT